MRTRNVSTASAKLIKAGGAYALGIFDLLLDHVSPHEKVTTGGSPQHALEGLHLVALDHTGDEAELDAEGGQALHLARADFGVLVITGTAVGLTRLREEHVVLLEHVLKLDELVVVTLEHLLVAVHLQQFLLEILETSLIHRGRGKLLLLRI